MELKPIVLLAALACVSESKRLVIPEGMRKINTGPSLAAAAPIFWAARSRLRP